MSVSHLLAAEPTVVGGGSVFSVLSIPSILVIVLGIYCVILAAKKHRVRVKSGASRRLNPLFKILCCFGGLIDFLIIGFLSGWDFDSDMIIFLLLLLIIPGVLSQCLYFVPYLIANAKGHPQEKAIFILNLLAGWTILAWIGALIWAYTETKTQPVIQKIDNSADQLLKYKQLLDSGVISQEEFETKKKNLLER